MSSASDVITEALATNPTTGDAILDALGNAGFVVMRSEGGPAWMPSTPRSLAKVQRYAQLAREHKDITVVARLMNVSVRHAERYAAAAAACGLLDKQTS
ncbi:hypothetical protein GCM10023194_80800 [Planotetraspora phitsanulokensis]|uniref:Uncharacterized protein n=1 Tax=Planotetraspora phitsanulokensis TaxID=575192 RepID=A0A8J3UCB0_9ACTN|nr:hypothetical protein [Planotetraspora phitsanulokensis]GII42838.1 hypothetical protein Pph01_78410 [Planotetraspora phitsanulokensis]